MTRLTESSINAYSEIYPTLGARQREVLEAFKASPMALCDLDVSETLNKPINTITPRRGELQKKGLIAWTGFKLNSLGRSVRAYMLTTKGAVIQ
jgi:hypothetical protein